MFVRVTILLFLLSLFVVGEKTTVTMRVYSSRENPQWYLEGPERVKFLSFADPLVGKEQHDCNRFASTLGYTGFEIRDPSLPKCLYVANNKEVETILLASYIKMRTRSNDDLNNILQVADHVAEVIQSGVVTELYTEFQNIPLSANEIIRGPDNVTRYNPDKWNKDITALRYNNCYNYATDVRTDTFAQPGKGSGSEYKSSTCTETWPASIRDGLTPLEKVCPTKEHPSVGHYVSLVIWPHQDFHWYRKDLDGFWSHKPGSTPVRNYDSSQQKILNPDKANIKPYT
ncbi:insoluble matrix shell protein [Acrasis kona]|uniref:Insoluble matrix shell protein n=1 Tax=Acrasis kona TaxID=1008807 RepID=A0AAW2Z9V4_9EUKA